MNLGRFLFVLVVVVIYGLLFSEQRMESQEKVIEIVRLEQELESLNAKKQELIALIDQDRQRLIKKSQSIGKPLSPKDIIIIE